MCFCWSGGAAASRLLNISDPVPPTPEDIKIGWAKNRPSKIRDTCNLKYGAKWIKLRVMVLKCSVSHACLIQLLSSNNKLIKEWKCHVWKVRTCWLLESLDEVMGWIGRCKCDGYARPAACGRIFPFILPLCLCLELLGGYKYEERKTMISWVITIKKLIRN